MEHEVDRIRFSSGQLAHPGPARLARASSSEMLSDWSKKALSRDHVSAALFSPVTSFQALTRRVCRMPQPTKTPNLLRICFFVVENTCTSCASRKTVAEFTNQRGRILRDRSRQSVRVNRQSIPSSGGRVFHFSAVWMSPCSTCNVKVILVFVYIFECAL